MTIKERIFIIGEINRDNNKIYDCYLENKTELFSFYFVFLVQKSFFPFFVYVH